MIFKQKWLGAILLIAVLCGAFIKISASAKDTPRSNTSCGVTDSLQKWQAYSKTATAITGDIYLSSKKIVFQNKKQISLSFISDESDKTGVPGDVYKIQKSDNPKLNSANHLCAKSPTYIAIQTQLYGAGSNGCSLMIFSSKDLPVNPNNMCASYNYTATNP